MNMLTQAYIQKFESTIMLVFYETDSRCASPYEFSTPEGKVVAGSRRISNLSSLSLATRFPSPISFAMERSPARENKSMGFPILNIPLLNSLPRCKQTQDRVQCLPCSGAIEMSCYVTYPYVALYCIVLHSIEFHLFIIFIVFLLRINGLQL